MVLQRMQQRRYTATQWTASNDTLLAGELGIELDTGKWKVGDGSTAWTGLAYQPSNAGITAAINAAVANLVNGAPGALDQLNELSAALGNDANFATTVTNALAAKAPSASPTFTGTVAGITKSMVGLGNVDNTADTAKPVSTAQATADGLRLQYRGAWAASTAYAINDAVTYQGVFYTAPTAFTSAATFTPGNWTALSAISPGKYNSGLYYYTNAPATGGTGALTNGQLRLHPWVLPNPITVTRVGVEITAAGNAGAVVRIGFYSDSSGQPGSLLLDAGTHAADATGIPEISGLTLTLPAGLYWIGVVVQNAATTAPTIRVAPTTYTAPAPIGATANAINSTILAYSATGTFTSGALPTTPTGLAAVATHARVYVKL